MEGVKLWISVKEAATLMGRTDKAVYEMIRTKRFPFQFRRAGSAIFISAIDIGSVVLPNEKLGDEPTEQQVAGATA